MEGWNVKAIREDGEIMHYEDSDLLVLDIDGIDFPEVELFTSPRAFGNGEIVSGFRKSGREINIKAILKSFDYNRYSVIRNRIIAFHNANYKFQLEIEYMGISRVAKNCYISFAKYPNARVKTNPILELTFESTEADLFANSVENTSFISKNPLWHDTRVYRGEKGSLVFGEIIKTTERVINYLGSEPTPLRATIKATGYVNKINVSLGNHKLTIDETLKKGDVLEIDGVTRLVTKNKELIAFSKYDANALYKLQLEYGDNIIKIDSGDNTAFSAEVEYEGRYGGL